MWRGQMEGSSRDNAPVSRARPSARGPHAVRRASLAGLLTLGLFMGSLSEAGAASALSRDRVRHHRTVPTATATTTTVPSATTTVVSLPQPTPPPAAPADTCVKPSWDVEVEGAPAAFTLGANGAYLWYDADGGWALRFTHAGTQDKLIFAGSLSTTTGQFIDVTPVSARGRDIVALSANKRTIYFRFVDFGLLDGLNFATHCTRTFTVNVHAGVALMPTGEIHLGTTAANPPADPFKVGRGVLLSARVKPPAVPAL